MKFHTTIRVSCLALVAGVYGGCIPYAVGSTARPALPGNTQFTISTYALPRKLELQQSPKNGLQIGFDAEARRGVGQQSDVGIRLVAGNGGVVTYKRRLDGVSFKNGPGVAIEVGGGVLNEFTHGEGEATLIVSGGEEGNFTPYGGLRGVVTTPLGESYTRDDPVYGGYLGFRLGRPEFGISFEAGVFRDRNQFQTDNRNVVVVPSVSFHGDFIALYNRLRNRNARRD